MDSSTHHWKLGLFVVVAVGIGVMTAFWLGAASLQERKPIQVVTYFNESVQGLTEGSAVKFRGVKIGEVASIRVAGDMTQLEVLCEVEDGALVRLQPPAEAAILPRIVNDLYTQLVSSSLTGQKYVAIDVIEDAREPVPEAIPEGIVAPLKAEIYIPSRRSTLKSVEEAVKGALAFFEGVGPDVGITVKNVAGVLSEIRNAELPGEARATLDRIDAAIRSFQARVEQLDTAGLSESTTTLLDEARSSLVELQVVLQSLAYEDAEQTVLSREINALSHQIKSAVDLAATEIRAARLPETAQSVRTGADAVTRAADAVGNASDRVSLLTEDLDQTLATLRETIDALRALIVVLEHDPSSILRGRTYGVPPPSASGPGGSGDPR